MNKKFLVTTILTLVLLLSMLTMASCDLTDLGIDLESLGIDPNKQTISSADAIKGTGIHVEDTVIYMSPSGKASTYQVNPLVLPEDATDKSVVYQMQTPTDAKYVSISADGLLTAKVAKVAEKEGDDTSIIIRVFLKSDRNIYVDLRVYVEIVEVTKISFTEAEMNVQLGGTEKVSVNPILIPNHATVEGSLLYESLNPEICEVDAYGVLTPKKVGQTTIEVSTPAASYEEPVVGRITINVTYAALAYNLNVVSDSARFKQIYNKAETLELALVCYDDLCDPNPTIIWYCDETALNLFRNNKICSYTPSSVPVGTHQIYAKLTDASGNVEFTTKYDLYIYNDIAGVDLNITNGDVGTFVENDIASISVSFKDGQYPPEQYNWYLKNGGVGGKDKYLGATSESYFNYRIDDSGELIVICEPVVKGVARADLRKEIELGTVGELQSDGCEIYGMYIEGAEISDGNYVPFVYWEAVGRPDAEITVEIQKGSQIITMSNVEGEYTSYFTRYGCYIPSTIADFNTTFEVRVRTDGYVYTDFVEYTAGQITENRFQYLRDIVPGMNGYISNMEELGKLINYVSLFHPSDLYYTAANNTIIPGYAGYSFNVYFNFAYSDLNANMYPVTSEPSSQDSAASQNVHRMISAAINCYCDSTQFSYVRVVNEATANVSLAFDMPDFYSSYYETEGTGLVNTYVDRSYSKSLRPVDVLPVDSVESTMSVANSNQLYFALSLGYRPIPVAGSSAETIYATMRSVLRRICNDSMSDEEKVHAIYDFLSTEVVYDYYATTMTDLELQRRAESFLLEGVFLRGRAVCDGISKSFNALCRMECIHAIKVVGFENENSVGHAWNKVMVNGQWYGVDATWGCSKSGTLEIQNHAFLLTTDAVLNKKHVTYGKTPATVGTINMIYYGTELASGVTHILEDASDVRYFAELVAAPHLTKANDEFIAEVMLPYMSVSEFTQAVGSGLEKMGFRISNVSFENNVYFVRITRVN